MPSSIPNISFEFFPPKTDLGKENLKKTWIILKKFNPQYCSVTHGAGGAGGAADHKTEKIIFELQKLAFKAMPHLTCIGTSKEAIKDIILRYQRNKIERVIALRGDYRAGTETTQGSFNYANELVQFIRNLSGQHFHITVAAYPEFHPHANHAFEDLKNFKRKVESGANSAITQYFYNADSYFAFVDSCEKLGIKIPITPGIMPIDSYERLARFSRSCGAEIPMWLDKRLQALQEDPAGLKEYGAEVVARLCETLLKNGAPGLHFYTLNQAEPTARILENVAF